MCKIRILGLNFELQVKRDVMKVTYKNNETYLSN
jgi:hypothetical protein